MSDHNIDVMKLAQLLSLYAPHDGKFGVSVPGVHVARASSINAEPNRVVSQLGLCIVAQGAKRVMTGDQIYEYDMSCIAVYSVEAPMTTNIIRASKSEPYLCLIVDIDPQRLSDLALKVYPRGLPRTPRAQPVYVIPEDSNIRKAGIRLMEMLSQPRDAELLAPLVIDEILIRLLSGPSGPSIAQLGAVDSNAKKISKVISWLRANYAEPMTIEELADIAGMSTSSLHQHFKDITSLSPLQFQKALRLQEARRLMLAHMSDVSTASQQVGYSSLSQFSREYKEFFGNPPTKDIAKLYEGGLAGAQQSADL